MLNAPMLGRTAINNLRDYVRYNRIVDHLTNIHNSEPLSGTADPERSLRHYGHDHRNALWS